MMDIMYIDSMPVLHIVDEATRFSAAQFLANIGTKAIWDALLRCWATVYTGLPNRILVDQGSQLGKSEPFISLARRSNVNRKLQGQKRTPVWELESATTNLYERYIGRCA